MAQKAPAMSPSDMPVSRVLERSEGLRRHEAEQLLELFCAISGQEPVVWANRIIGFGEYEYKYASGHGGWAPILAFAPGPKHHTIYLPDNFEERWPEQLANLGKYRSSKACLYISRLSYINLEVLSQVLVLAKNDVMGTEE